MASKSPQIFVNLPVTALEPAIDFYTAIGFTPNPKFSDPTTMMMVLSSAIHVMLIMPSRFTGFMPANRTISDARKTTEVLLCLSADSKEGVDDMVAKAVAAGGKGDVAAKQEMDGMYGRSFEDLDGHVWSVMWLNGADTRPQKLEE